MIEIFGQDLNWSDASLSSFPSLGENELHIWWLPLQLDYSQSETALNLLSDIQRDKYHRRSSEQLRQNYLAGRYFLLNLLGAYAQKCPNEIRLSYSRLNKPSVSDSTIGLEFNFTDTEGFGVFVFTKHRQVGVDIESLYRKSNFKAIAERRFTQQELDYVYQDGELNTQRCLCIWTRKEAFGKATGMGINFQMNQRNLYGGRARGEHRFEDEHGVKWRCLQLQLGKSFISSVVHEQHTELELKAFRSFKV